VINPSSLSLRWWRAFCFKGQLEVVDALPLEGTNSASSSIIGGQEGSTPTFFFFWFISNQNGKCVPWLNQVFKW